MLIDKGVHTWKKTEKENMNTFCYVCFRYDFKLLSKKYITGSRNIDSTQFTYVLTTTKGNVTDACFMNNLSRGKRGK